ncbi:glycosyltransferase family 25 protein (plasmid) [Rhizobium lusitanum]|uniref:glycosyltransferase family 25 protein n=1 Tax=Rhizobium lusitanum TaxID=293958 RepID=UPI001622BE2E|nr:glycosyltransferase family 25 protein [Rhizobium lusitanum]QND44556.1 glycosyltransferase family 25 protein [Rhizobium lusitanum]
MNADSLRLNRSATLENIALENPPKEIQLDSTGLRLKIYLINLDRAEDRLAFMSEELSRAGLLFERVSAIDGRNIAFPIPEFDAQAYRRCHGRQANPSEVGCYLSHIECARRFLASGEPHALILEDDLTFPEDFGDLLRASLNAAATWDILRLSTVNTGRKYPFVDITPRRSLAVALTREKGSGAYIINRRAARWMVEKLVPMRLPYDIAYDLEHFAGLRAVFVVPAPVDQMTNFPTQIQQGRRQYRLPWWRRLSIYPYRAWFEASRFLFRAGMLLRFRLVK